MQRIVAVMVCCLLASAGAQAGAQSSGAAVSAKSLNATNERVVKRQAEVDHLQKDVGQQEATSQDATERLQQQDRTIAELRQQLKAAQEASRTPAAGH
jgi:peptidoglycan hydrolase CwlO-like protein